MEPDLATVTRATARILAEDRAVRRPHPDPALEALTLAVLLEDAFGVTLTGPDLDAGLLSDPVRAAAVLSRLRTGTPPAGAC